MRIQIITPAGRASKSGNRTTALRWSRFLRGMGHDVTLATEADGSRRDLLIALHAVRSHEAMIRFHERFPEKPIILVLTGTDLSSMTTQKHTFRRSIAVASRLVVLQPLALKQLPQSCRRKTHVILQSAMAPKPPKSRQSRFFDVCVIGHLRAVKDPLRTALAARGLPETSRIRIRHIGAALEDRMASLARTEMRRNPRYRWFGEMPRWRALRILRSCKMMVLSSISEGGANVISESVACGIPILASRIDGSVGLLGKDYPGYFPVGDTRGLLALLKKGESSPAYYQKLKSAVAKLQPRFSPEKEQNLIKALLAELFPAGGD